MFFGAAEEIIKLTGNDPDPTYDGSYAQQSQCVNYTTTCPGANHTDNLQKAIERLTTG